MTREELIHSLADGGMGCRCPFCEAAAMLRSDGETIERMRAALLEILNFCTETKDVDAVASRGLGVPYSPPKENNDG